MSSFASSSSDPTQTTPTASQTEDEDANYDEDEASTTVSFTRSTHERWFQTRFGNTFLAEDQSYWRPVDESHTEVEEAWHRWKLLHGLYPPAAADLVEGLMNKTGARFLDIGAGRKALWLIAMAERFPEAEGVAVDLLPPLECDVPPNCSFEIYDVLGGLPYTDGLFSLVSHSWLIPYLKDKPYSFLVDEISRVLVPGGIYLLLEICNIWTCEDGTTLDQSFPSIAKFLEIYRKIALKRGSGSLDKEINFGGVVADSGRFSSVVERSITIRVGAQPATEYDPINDLSNESGNHILAVLRAGYRSWVPLALGWSLKDAMKLEVDVQAELDSSRARKLGEGLRGKAACMWAVRSS